ncbi:Holliday junction DNA helicase [Pigmentiphaga litoralis]|uniref:RusA family crossover junction endodeoxyribonuclease n=1 Tax=Pigmentiphaga litoralis TaxID=516702 RepID=UPI0019C97FAA|nr:RusA family crossover junction endodeoxyribonuclease [Pigmentiphaga litoralis]GGX30449.1 Holliday junction DNA helicase [Pigmentiphaga litoralis]
MAEIAFMVPGVPVGKGRPRASKTKAGVRMYTPAKTVSYEAVVAHAGRQAMAGRDPEQGALAVVLSIVVPIPASWSGAKQERAAFGLIMPTTKPDIDNIEKAIFDALNGICWRDDVQVTDVMKIKRYGRQPGVRVTIKPLTSEA